MAEDAWPHGAAEPLDSGLLVPSSVVRASEPRIGATADADPAPDAANIAATIVANPAPVSRITALTAEFDPAHIAAHSDGAALGTSRPAAIGGASAGVPARVDPWRLPGSGSHSARERPEPVARHRRPAPISGPVVVAAPVVSSPPARMWVEEPHLRPEPDNASAHVVEAAAGPLDGAKAASSATEGAPVSGGATVAWYEDPLSTQHETDPTVQPSAQAPAQHRTMNGLAEGVAPADLPTMGQAVIPRAQSAGRPSGTNGASLGVANGADSGSAHIAGASNGHTNGHTNGNGHSNGNGKSAGGEASSAQRPYLPFMLSAAAPRHVSTARRAPATGPFVRPGAAPVVDTPQLPDHPVASQSQPNAETVAELLDEAVDASVVAAVLDESVASRFVATGDTQALQQPPDSAPPVAQRAEVPDNTASIDSASDGTPASVASESPAIDAPAPTVGDDFWSGEFWQSLRPITLASRTGEEPLAAPDLARFDEPQQTAAILAASVAMDLPTPATVSPHTDETGVARADDADGEEGADQLRWRAEMLMDEMFVGAVDASAGERGRTTYVAFDVPENEVALWKSAAADEALMGHATPAPNGSTPIVPGPALGPTLSVASSAEGDSFGSAYSNGYENGYESGYRNGHGAGVASSGQPSPAGTAVGRAADLP
ncbi:MAG: hypothetical protein ACRC1H_12965, partial [Caldilineaceae bacterium]